MDCESLGECNLQDQCEERPSLVTSTFVQYYAWNWKWTLEPMLKSSYCNIHITVYLSWNMLIISRVALFDKIQHSARNICGPLDLFQSLINNLSSHFSAAQNCSHRRVSIIHLETQGLRVWECAEKFRKLIINSRCETFIVCSNLKQSNRARTQRSTSDVYWVILWPEPPALPQAGHTFTNK